MRPAGAVSARICPRGFGIGFLQWVSWVMRERYLFTDPDLSGLTNFSNYRGAMRALCFTDDPWATRPSVELLVLRIYVDRTGNHQHRARRRRRRQDRPFRLFSPRAPRLALARRGGMDFRRRNRLALASRSRAPSRSGAEPHDHRWPISLLASTAEAGTPPG